MSESEKTYVAIPTAEAQKQRRPPWLRALRKFNPIMLMMLAAMNKDSWTCLVFPLVAFGYLWMNEEDDE